MGLARKTSQAMTKLRNPSNRIGSTGEKAFALFADHNGVLATKAGEDVGLDFLCQVDEDHEAKGSSEIAGAVIGFAVRSTAADGGRVRLDRDDAEFLLRMDTPVGVVLVTDPKEDPSFHHRMVDEAFTNELVEFLASGRETMSLTPAQCRDASEFRADVLRSLGPGEVERRRVAVAKQRLSAKVAIGRIQIVRDDSGAITVVSALDLWSLFDQLGDENRRLLHYATFGAPELLQERVAAMVVREDLIEDLDRLPEPYMIRGSIQNAESELRVEGPGGEARCRLRLTRNGEHYGYVHDGGFAITVSKRKEKGGVWVHEFEAFADPDVGLDLEDHPDLWAFLTACVPGAVVIDEAVPDWRFGVEQFAYLPWFGAFAACLKDASALPGWSSRIAELRDALDEETMNSVQWLAAVASDLTRIPKPAFVLEGDDGSADPESEPGRWTVPVVVNTTRASAVTWLTCSGELFLRNDAVVGVRTEEYHDVRVDVVEERAAKGTIEPEFVFDPSSTALALGETKWTALEPVEGRGPEAFQVETHQSA
jgi:hypothetical protein